MLWFDAKADITDEVIAAMREAGAGLERAAPPATAVAPAATGAPAPAEGSADGEG